MNCIFRKALLLFSLLLISPFIHADEDQDILNWSEQTLISTLTVSYNQKVHNWADIKKNYSYNAWSGITEFLGSSMETIRKKRLVLHPVLESEPQLLHSGVNSGIQFWRVKVVISVPELNSTLDFTLVVIASNPDSETPYIIHSINIQVTPL